MSALLTSPVAFDLDDLPVNGFAPISLDDSWTLTGAADEFEWTVTNAPAGHLVAHLILIADTLVGLVVNQVNDTVEAGVFDSEEAFEATQAVEYINTTAYRVCLCARQGCEDCRYEAMDHAA